MVVVAVVTDLVAVRWGYTDTQQCALDIEAELLRRFICFGYGGYLANSRTYHPGRRECQGAIGYPLYITVTLVEESPWVLNRPSWC